VQEQAGRSGRQLHGNPTGSATRAVLVSGDQSGGGKEGFIIMRHNGAQRDHQAVPCVAVLL
jgi:hypothetical protein